MQRFCTLMPFATEKVRTKASSDSLARSSLHCGGIKFSLIHIAGFVEKTLWCDFRNLSHNFRVRKFGMIDRKPHLINLLSIRLILAQILEADSRRQEENLCKKWREFDRAAGTRVSFGVLKEIGSFFEYSDKFATFLFVSYWYVKKQWFIRKFFFVNIMNYLMCSHS